MDTVRQAEKSYPRKKAESRIMSFENVLNGGEKTGSGELTCLFFLNVKAKAGQIFTAS